MCVGRGEDYTKIGMECVNEPYKSFVPDAVTFCGSDAIVIQYRFPREATEHCGCPERGDLLVSVGEDGDLLWISRGSENRPTA